MTKSTAAWLVGVAMVAVWLPSGAVAEPQPITRAEMIANSCFSCHGRTEDSVGSMPSIVGMNQEALERLMIEFREGRAAATVMDRHATGYSDESIRRIAEYVSGLKGQQGGGR